MYNDVTCDLLYSYLARAVIIPFIYEAPPIRVDTLDAMLSEAHRALPEAIGIGHWLKSVPQSELHDMVNKIQEEVKGGMDGRLALQYAVYTLCAMQVCKDM